MDKVTIEVMGLVGQGNYRGHGASWTSSLYRSWGRLVKLNVEVLGKLTMKVTGLIGEAHYRGHGAGWTRALYMSWDWDKLMK